MLAYTTFLFYTSTKLVPEGTEKFRLHIGEETVDFSKNDNGKYTAVFSISQEDRQFEVQGGMVEFSDFDDKAAKMAVQMIIGEEKEWENEIPIKVEDFGMPIKLIRDSNSISYQQEEGIFSKLNAKVVW
jgi:hypothetical protein